MAKPLAPYRTYIIRCWQEPCGHPNAGISRFSLEIAATGERFGFTRPEDLTNALSEALAQLQNEAISDGSPKKQED